MIILPCSRPPTDVHTFLHDKFVLASAGNHPFTFLETDFPLRWLDSIRWIKLLNAIAYSLAEEVISIRLDKGMIDKLQSEYKRTSWTRHYLLSKYCTQSTMSAESVLRIVLRIPCVIQIGKAWRNFVAHARTAGSRCILGGED